MAAARDTSSTVHRWRITVTGTVQGVGYRPFVYQLAAKLRVGGWVCNTGDGVLIEAEGDEATLAAFADGLAAEAPPLARVTAVSAVPIDPLGESDFRIDLSRGSGRGAGGVQTDVPPDVATCADCLADVSDVANRRYRYPFTNCTNCGPRFTIIRGIPYDRPQTTMAGFALCPDCHAEYDDPGDRRFHAQPNACPVCGPHLILDGERPGDGEAVTRAAGLLRDGKVFAIKGLGGYHLACDARSSHAVSTLRDRKGRAGKPFAVMCASIDEARRVCDVGPEAEALLLSPMRPIVLLPLREGADISPLVAPALREIGVMLPYTPLHHLLLAEAPPTLVMTSGNLSEEPIVHRDDDAHARLGALADHFLEHDRPIHVPCDDSVVRIDSGAPVILRRARGYVPSPIDLGRQMPSILACGGDLKSTFCLTRGTSALLSQHLGDLANVAAIDHYRDMVEHFRAFFRVTPEVIAHDLHPDYHSTRFALSLDGRKVAVQHHHAHIAACMAEHRLDGPVLGVSFDGTGFGADGTIWGGEFLVAEYHDFRRAGFLAPVPLPGGEASIRRPGRLALAYLISTFGQDEAVSLAEELVPSLSDQEISTVALQVERGLNSPLTSSMGRLFDAVSALVGVCTDVRYEGQAAMEFEAIAASDGGVYPFAIARIDGALQIDWHPLFAALVSDLRQRVPASTISHRFHATIAGMVASVCTELRGETGLDRVVLSGGVFQNALLTDLTVRRLTSAGFSVYRHSLVPCNDGGLSLGQAVVAAEKERRGCA